MTQGVFVAVKHSGISYRRFSHFLPKTKTRLVKPPRAVFNLNDLCLGRDQTCLRIQAASEEVTQQLGNVVIGPPFFFFPTTYRLKGLFEQHPVTMMGTFPFSHKALFTFLHCVLMCLNLLHTSSCSLQGSPQQCAVLA